MFALITFDTTLWQVPPERCHRRKDLLPPRPHQNQVHGTRHRQEGSDRSRCLSSCQIRSSASVCFSCLVFSSTVYCCLLRAAAECFQAVFSSSLWLLVCSELIINLYSRALDAARNVASFRSVFVPSFSLLRRYSRYVVSLFQRSLSDCRLNLSSDETRKKLL